MNDVTFNNLREQYPHLRSYFMGAAGWSPEMIDLQRANFRKSPILIKAGLIVGSVLLLGNVIPAMLFNHPGYFSKLGFIIGVVCLAFSLYQFLSFRLPRSKHYFSTYNVELYINAEILKTWKEAPRVREYLKRMREVGKRETLMIADILELEHLHSEFAHYSERKELRTELAREISE